MTMNGNVPDIRALLLVCMSLTGLLTFPGISCSLWKVLNNDWAVRMARKLWRRKREAGAKLKKYSVIDMRKFR